MQETFWFNLRRFADSPVTQGAGSIIVGVTAGVVGNMIHDNRLLFVVPWLCCGVLAWEFCRAFKIPGAYRAYVVLGIAILSGYGFYSGYKALSPKADPSIQTVEEKHIQQDADTRQIIENARNYVRGLRHFSDTFRQKSEADSQSRWYASMNLSGPEKDAARARDFAEEEREQHEFEAQFNQEWRTPIFSLYRDLREDLKSRGIDDPIKKAEAEGIFKYQMAQETLTNGNGLAGPNPVGDIADYLDFLADTLAKLLDPKFSPAKSPALP